MARSRTETANTQPVPATDLTKHEPAQTEVEEDTRIVFMSWDCALVPSLPRND